MKNKEHGKLPKKFEHSELQALLDEDDAQTQQLADQLNVWHKKPSPYVWNLWEKSKDGKMSSTTEWKTAGNRKITCEMLLARYKRKSFLNRIVMAMKSGYILRILSVKDHG